MLPSKKSLFGNSKGSIVNKLSMPPKSQALIHEFQLEEMKNCYSGLRTEKVNICFEILEDLIDKSGAYKKVLSTIRDELKQAVFSQVITSTKDEPFMEQIPYFSLIQRFEKQRIEKSTKSNDYV